jgi:VIT1/CCC1 family predicted Fe2+/Mn2+ transporter
MSQSAISALGAQPAHGVAGRLNSLRAGVLGANDGIVSVAGLVAGVAGATTDRATIVTAGVAGLVAGALSMGGGEYVSVSTQRDTERALLAEERSQLADLPEAELDELVGIYRAKGLSPALARQVAVELTAHDPLAAHADAELRIDPGRHVRRGPRGGPGGDLGVSCRAAVDAPVPNACSGVAGRPPPVRGTWGAGGARGSVPGARGHSSATAIRPRAR